MPPFGALSLAVLGLFMAVDARNIDVINKCAFTIWPGLFTTGGGPVTNHTTGWESPSGTVRTVTVPEGWGGRIWGRTGCNFNITGPSQCETGGCIGGLLCDPVSGTGVPPASIAQWTLRGQDFYGVSLVDGFNLPIRIEAINCVCPTGECPFDLNPKCPAVLRQLNAAGTIVGCKSACFAGIDGNRADSANCCTGSHSLPATCPSSGVQYYDYFHGSCQNAYNYAFDDVNGLKNCNAQTDFTLTFCP